jgi:PAS domain S-box-containing protein
MIAFRALGGADAATLKEYALELEQVLEQIAEAVIVKDLNAVVMFWNREAASLYGFSAAEAVGKPLRELHAAELPDADYAKLLERIRAGVQTSSTGERRKKNGEIVTVEIKTTPLFDVKRNLIGEITVARDVTALHHQKEALRAAQAALQERLVALGEANRSLAREISARKKSDVAIRRNNRALVATVQQLEAFHRDGEVLSRMAELLQSCGQRGEAYEIVRETGAQLFPKSSGSLFIYRESRDVLEHVAQWGGGPPADKTLAPDECWALRLGSAHFAPSNGSLRCGHAREQHRGYACVPFHVQGQILGLFHIALDVDPGSRRPARVTEQRLQAMTDRVGPALSNLRLRDAMREMALRDGLTGLYNRRYLEDALNREIHRAERSGQPLAVIMIDIDNFTVQRPARPRRGGLRAQCARSRNRPQYSSCGSGLPVWRRGIRRGAAGDEHRHGLPARRGDEARDPQHEPHAPRPDLGGALGLVRHRRLSRRRLDRTGLAEGRGPRALPREARGTRSHQRGAEPGAPRRGAERVAPAQAACRTHVG